MNSISKKHLLYSQYDQMNKKKAMKTDIDRLYYIKCTGEDYHNGASTNTVCVCM